MQRANPAAVLAALLLPLALLLSTGTLRAEEFVAPAGVTLLNEKQIRAEIIGNTLTGSGGSSRWTEYYLTNGVIKGVSGGDRYGGDWTVSGPVMCWNYQGDEYDACGTMSRDGDKVLFYSRDGEPTGSATLSEGNDKGL